MMVSLAELPDRQVVFGGCQVICGHSFRRKVGLRNELLILLQHLLYLSRLSEAQVPSAECCALNE